MDRVALGEWPYLRPSVNTQSHSEELGLLMQCCWAEEPSDRPEFNHISLLLRKQNRSVSSQSVSVTLCLVREKVLSQTFLQFTDHMENLSRVNLACLLPASIGFRHFLHCSSCISASKDDLMLTFCIFPFFSLFIILCLSSVSLSGSTEVTSWIIFCLVWSSMPITWRSL